MQCFIPSEHCWPWIDKIQRNIPALFLFFNQHYIKTGKIDAEYSNILTAAFRIRNKSDYNDFFIAAREDAQIQLENGRKFLAKVEKFLETIVEHEEEQE